jgi:hypothetical protein
LKLLISIVALVAQISPLILFFLYYRKINKVVELKVIFFYSVLSLISIVILSSPLKKYGSSIVSIFAICEFIFFSTLLFLCVLNKKFKNLIAAIAGVNLIFELFLFFFHPENFDFWVTLSTAILIFIFSIFFFFEQVNTPETLLIYQSYKFWIIVGCIIYLAGTLFVFLYTSDMKDKIQSALWDINIAFEIIKNVCFSIAFLVARTTKENMMTSDFDDTNMLEKPF